MRIQPVDNQCGPQLSRTVRSTSRTTRSEYWIAFILGTLGAFVGSTLFAIATFRTAALSRGAALLLGVSSILTIGAGQGGNILGPVPLVVTSLGFALGWFMLGINAVRLDRPASEARPA